MGHIAYKVLPMPLLETVAALNCSGVTLPVGQIRKASTPASVKPVQKSQT